MGQGAGAPRAQLSNDNVSQVGVLELELDADNVVAMGSSDGAVAGECDLHVVTGVHSKGSPLHGQIIILAEHLPSWLVLLQGQTVYEPLVLTKFDCSWFMAASHLRGNLLSSTLSGDWTGQLPAAPAGQRRVFLVQGSRSFCLDTLDSLSAVLTATDVALAVFNGRPPFPMLPGLYGSRLKHSDVGGVTSGGYSVVASVSLLNDAVSKPWHVTAMPRFLVDLLKVDIPGTSCGMPVSGLDPRRFITLPSLLEPLPAPSVFSATGWIRRRLLPSEFGLALDLPLASLDALELELGRDPTLASILTRVAPLKVLQSAVTLLWPQPVISTAPVVVPRLAPGPVKIDYVTPLESVEADLLLAQSKATKSDDAKTNVALWDNRAVTPPLDPLPSWNGAAQSTTTWLVATGVFDAKRHGPLFAALRHLMLLRFRHNVRRSSQRYLEDKYSPEDLDLAPGSCLERDRDVDGVADCINRADAATFWDWNGGSSPFFWRWQPAIQRDMRDGTPLFVTGSLPSFTKPQQMPRDASIASRIKAKLNKVRFRLYIAVGLVLSLTAYFHVPKGDDDIRMVYDLTASGLNEVLWAPSFWMPTIQNVLDCATDTSWFGDVDAGEMFLNYWLDPAIRPYAGVDVSWDTDGGGSGGKRWERWTRMAMGMLPSPWVTTRLFAWAMELMKGDRRDPTNPFHWSEVKLNLPGSSSYDPAMPRVYKWNEVERCIASDCKTFVDDLRSIGATRELCRACTHQIEARMSYLGLQDATRKKRDGSRAPGEWTGTIQRSIPGLGVFATVSQKKWDKAKGYLLSIKRAYTAATDLPQLNLKELESQVGFFVHLAMTFPVMFPFLKGFYLTMNSWRPAREENGWKMSRRAHAAFMQESRRGSSDTTWPNDRDDKNAPVLVKGLPLLLEHVDTLLELMSSERPSLRLIRGANKPALEVIYVFGDASGAGFGASWTMPTSEAVGYRYGIWGREGNNTSSNYREFRNLVETLEEMGARGDLEGREIFVFTDNMVSESIAAKGSSASKALYELVVRVFRLEMSCRCNISFIHVAGTRMIAQGTDGLSRGEMYEGVMSGQPMLSFVPLHLSAVDRSPALLDWINSWAKEVRNEPLTLLDPEGWFERGHDISGGDRNIDGCWIPRYQPATMLWAPPPAAARQVIEELRQARQKRQTSMHIFACPRLMYDEYRRHLFKSADLILVIEAGIYDWWPASMHESLIIGIFFPYLSRCPWELRKTQLLVGMARKMRYVFKKDPAAAGNLLSEFCRFTRRLDTMPVRVLRSVLSGRSRFAVPCGKSVQ